MTSIRIGATWTQRVKAHADKYPDDAGEWTTEAAELLYAIGQAAPGDHDARLKAAAEHLAAACAEDIDDGEEEQAAIDVLDRIIFGHLAAPGIDAPDA